MGLGGIRFRVLDLKGIRACVRACVRVCVRACVRACVRCIRAAGLVYILRLVHGLQVCVDRRPGCKTIQFQLDLPLINLRIIVFVCVLLF